MDLRQSSPTFGRWTPRTLTAEGGEMPWIAEGFTHGYLTLSATVTATYDVTVEYDPPRDRATRWNDAENPF